VYLCFLLLEKSTARLKGSVDEDILQPLSCLARFNLWSDPNPRTRVAKGLRTTHKLMSEEMMSIGDLYSSEILECLVPSRPFWELLNHYQDSLGHDSGGLWYGFLQGQDVQKTASGYLSFWLTSPENAVGS
jgi:hypothetical protein